MSKKTETKTTREFDPGSKSTFDKLQSPIAQVLTDYMKDPLKATYFNNMLGMTLNQNSLIGARNIQNVGDQYKYLGGGTSGALQAARERVMRANSANDSNSFLQLLLNSENIRRQATGQAMAYNPLQTGQTEVQKQSGLGTWLPQVIGAGLSGAAAFATGGASLAAKAGMGALSAGSNLASGWAGGATAAGVPGLWQGGTSKPPSFWGNS